MNKSKNVISINQDSEFFFRAGMRCISKKRFQSALKYLTKAAQMEPFNADYQFNLGCVLAELKEVKKSNERLLNILKNIDPTLTECYFGIACNYFDMENFKKAREYLEKYIYSDPNGVYVDEAYDILFYLQIHDDAGVKKNIGRKVSEYSVQGTKLLDEGNYASAKYYLEKAIEANLEVISPRNNLSLVHFFTEDVDKAISLAMSVLKLEQENVFALCNLAIFYAYKKDTKKYDELIKKLCGLNIESKEEMSKIINTFKVLKEHNCIVAVLIKYLRKNREPLYFHMLAVGLYNINRFDFAEEIWAALNQAFPQYSIIARYFKKLNQDTESGAVKYSLMDYSNKLPENIEVGYKEKFESFLQIETTLLEKLWKSDSDIMDIVIHYIYTGEIDARLAAVNKLVLIEDMEIIQVLKGIAADENAEEDVRKIISNSLGLNNKKAKPKNILKIVRNKKVSIKKSPI